MRLERSVRGGRELLGRAARDDRFGALERLGDELERVGERVRALAVVFVAPLGLRDRPGRRAEDPPLYSEPMSTVEQAADPFWLSGNYAPVFDEITALDLPVTGSVPADLQGLYVRNGANPQSGWSSHWFFGNGMLHGVRLEGGRAAWYRNRYVRTPLYEVDGDRIAPESIADRTMSAANTHVVGHAGRIFALEEGAFPFEVDGELETLGCETWGGRLTTAFTAHPKLCPLTGELHFFGYGVFPPYLTYHVLDASGELVKSEPITVPGPTMMHDFMITSEHAIFMDLPVVIDLELAMRGEPPLQMERRLRRAGRGDAERRLRRRRALVRSRPLLRLPSVERVDRRHEGRVRRRHGTRRCGARA